MGGMNSVGSQSCSPLIIRCLGVTITAHARVYYYFLAPKRPLIDFQKCMTMIEVQVRVYTCIEMLAVEEYLGHHFLLLSVVLKLTHIHVLLLLHYRVCTKYAWGSVNVLNIVYTQQVQWHCTVAHIHRV